mmetsp:Transcript_36184/g.76241  ORF Transcript_36184/g.76241 Transcript_36184/m.76241 type:complete len:225 (+) Transcript_36184:935-1609(+)
MVPLGKWSEGLAMASMTLDKAQQQIITTAILTILLCPIAEAIIILMKTRGGTAMTAPTPILEPRPRAATTNQLTEQCPTTINHPIAPMSTPRIPTIRATTTKANIPRPLPPSHRLCPPLLCTKWPRSIAWDASVANPAVSRSTASASRTIPNVAHRASVRIVAISQTQLQEALIPRRGCLVLLHPAKTAVHPQQWRLLHWIPRSRQHRRHCWTCLRINILIFTW